MRFPESFGVIELALLVIGVDFGVKHLSLLVVVIGDVVSGILNWNCSSSCWINSAAGGSGNCGGGVICEGGIKNDLNSFSASSSS